MFRETRTVIPAALTCLLSGQALGSVVYFDGVFSPTNWASTTVTDVQGAGSTSFETQFLTGGNGNEYMRIELNLVANAPGASVWSLNTNTNASYNPGTQGAITAINYSEDSRNFMPAHNGNVQGTGLLITQGGINYVMRGPTLVMPNPTFSNWALNSAPGLVSTDFWELTNAGVLISSSNPDFTAAGGIMHLGFWRAGSSGTFVGTDFRDAGIDNWRVEIVPSPGPLALLAVGGLTALRRRR